MSRPPGGGPPRRRLAAQAVHRVRPEDVGQRVSIRHLVDTGAGPQQTDVVGRLLGYEAGVLALVDRAGQLALVGEGAIVSSRVVPPHPRLPAEPYDVGTADRPLERDAARVVLLDRHDGVALVAHRASATRTVWTAPGGGLLPGETHEAAASRELREELGVSADLGPWIWSRHVRFTYAGVHLHQHERWFLVRVAAWDPDDAPLDDPGLSAVRRWTVPELRATDEILAPAALADHLEVLLRDGTPVTPVDVGR